MKITTWTNVPIRQWTTWLWIKTQTLWRMRDTNILSPSNLQSLKNWINWYFRKGCWFKDRLGTMWRVSLFAVFLYLLCKTTTKIGSLAKSCCKTHACSFHTSHIPNKIIINESWLIATYLYHKLLNCNSNAKVQVTNEGLYLLYENKWCSNGGQ